MEKSQFKLEYKGSNWGMFGTVLLHSLITVVGSLLVVPPLFTVPWSIREFCYYVAKNTSVTPLKDGSAKSSMQSMS